MGNREASESFYWVIRVAGDVLHLYEKAPAHLNMGGKFENVYSRALFFDSRTYTEPVLKGLRERE